jgi:hypothetical protein
MRSLNLIAALTILAFSPSAYALVILGQEPPASKIITAGNGLEWVYAAPCAGEGPSCGTVQLHHDFRFATAEEWFDSFLDLSGLIAAFGLNNYNSSICAATAFSTVHDHCDPLDVINGFVWHAPLGIAASAAHANNAAAETFLVRGPVVSVPEPGALSLLGMALVGFGIARRKRSATAGS